MQVLKKAQRDCGQQIRTLLTTLKDSVTTEITSTFNRFSGQVLGRDSSQSSLCAVREEYLHMDPRSVVMTILNKVCHLYSTVMDHQLSWDQGGINAKAAKRAAHKQNDVLSQFIRYMDQDKLLQKLFQVFY